MRGLGGFGLRHHLRTDRPADMSENFRWLTVAVGDYVADRVALRRLDEAAATRDATVAERARMMRGDGPVTDAQEFDEATKLTMYVGRQDASRAPAYAAICDLLHRRGDPARRRCWGWTARPRRRERARFFDRNLDVPRWCRGGCRGTDRAGAPELGPAAPADDHVERVRVCKTRRHTRPAPHLPAPTTWAATVAEADGLHLGASMLQASPFTGPSSATAPDPGAAAPPCWGVWGYHGRTIHTVTGVGSGVVRCRL